MKAINGQFEPITYKGLIMIKPHYRIPFACTLICLLISTVFYADYVTGARLYFN